MSKGKVHLRITGVDCRDSGQTQFEYEHQTKCGYVRDNVTRNISLVTCKICERELIKESEAHFNKQVY